jgi:uncharacterized protein YkwD
VRAGLAVALSRRRIELGLPTVAPSAALDVAAQAQAEAMAAGNWLGFTSPAGTTIESRVDVSGFRAELVAAKVYRAPAADGAGALAERWWRDPEPSRQSVFHSGVREVGIGIARRGGERFFAFVLAKQPPPGPPPSMGADLPDRRAAFLAAANAARAGGGLGALHTDPRLDRAAQGFAEDVLAAPRAGRSLATVEILPQRVTAELPASPTILSAGALGGSAVYGERTPAKQGTKERAGAIGQTLVVDALSASQAVALAAAETAPDLLAPGYTQLGVGVAYDGEGAAPHAVWVACLTRHR